ncbi:hypothetical protein LKO27_08080 [Tessaracoccus sp. OS52]|uniref:hypothetical protein n=1 Tax=Tessaracoccus sp. OS52 TaxID=2886691 RepID=UPI001D0F6354|nr:hypothetical protein [Tessaracoccus sp. OS52]MCC2593364.1 hypothetical protein [Tessaracoccus sp. OS52]
MAAATPRALSLVGRVLGMVIAVVAVLAGVGLLLLAIFAQFDTRSNIHPFFRPDAVYSSFDGPAELRDPSNEYAITSLNSGLDECTVRSLNGPLELRPDADPYFTARSVFRFTAPPGTYQVTCSPDVWFEIYRGADVELAVRGYEGSVHPSVYYLLGSAVFLGVGMWLWHRFVQKPKRW